MTSWRNRNLHWVINDTEGFEHCKMEKACKSERQKEQRLVQNTEHVGVEKWDRVGCSGKANRSDKVLRKVTRDR